MHTPPLAIYLKFAVPPETATLVVDLILALIARTRAAHAGVLRSDLFFSEAMGEGALILRFADAAALGAYLDEFGTTYADLQGLAEVSAEGLGVDMAAAARFASRARCFTYAQGLGIDAPIPDDVGDFPADLVEIYTPFTIAPGKFPEFRRQAQGMIDIVRAKDPGTLRYDWYFDEASSTARARDIYRDAESLFAHMKNCNAVHTDLLACTTAMTNEFLGDLPQPVLDVVSKYETYILPFRAGLRDRSTGAYR